jgi:hypothetical protein
VIFNDSGLCIGNDERFLAQMFGFAQNFDYGTVVKCRLKPIILPNCY